MSTIAEIRQVTRDVDSSLIHDQVRHHLDDHFSDLGILTGHAAGPSQVGQGIKRGKKRRNLDEEIKFWEGKVSVADGELNETSKTLPGLLQSTQERLQKLLESAQELSIKRYALADQLSTLISELDSSRGTDSKRETEGAETGANEAQKEQLKGKTILEQMEELQNELSRLEAGLVWVGVVEQVVVFSEKTLNPQLHKPSPLAGLPHYTELHKLVDRVLKTLPEGMGLVTIILEIRENTWKVLKEILAKRKLLDAAEGLKWPMKVDYPSVPAENRRAFERAFEDLLYLQSEGEALGLDGNKRKEWYEGKGLYPLQAMIEPISLRFKYHFQGSKNTNRVDKPEWAFTSILDRIYEHQAFIEEYLEPLTRRVGYTEVDVKSEFMIILFPILLNMLRSRIPHILDSPALLAHTIYQTVIFDDAIRENGFDFDHVTINEGVENAQWEGLAGLILREKGWFQSWLSGEKKFAEAQLQEIISSSDAWNISDEAPESGDGMSEDDLKPTISARQVKALIEQVTDRYSPLPSLQHRLPFLTSIQLPLLATYHSRINGSLDAFETLSSAFVRVVPGALAGNTRSGAHIDQTKLTSGKAGLERLIKASLSAGYVLSALRSWSDEIFFVEMAEELRHDSKLRVSMQNELLLSAPLRYGDAASVFDILIERYGTLVSRSEDMIVRQVSAEVENDLKQHLKRRWDRTEGDGAPDSSLLHALTTYSSHSSTLPLLPDIPRSRVYRRIASHLSNHILQRAVYAGWSKFSVLGGQDLKAEIEDWVNTSNAIDLPGGEMAIKSPWKDLAEAAKVLALKEEDEDGDAQEAGGKNDVTFGQAMAVAWSDREEAWKSWKERTGWSGDRNALQAVLKRRLDCWR